MLIAYDARWNHYFWILLSCNKDKKSSAIPTSFLSLIFNILRVNAKQMFTKIVLSQNKKVLIEMFCLIMRKCFNWKSQALTTINKIPTEILIIFYSQSFSPSIEQQKKIVKWTQRVCLDWRKLSKSSLAIKNVKLFGIIWNISMERGPNEKRDAIIQMKEITIFIASAHALVSLNNSLKCIRW